MIASLPSRTTVVAAALVLFTSGTGGCATLRAAEDPASMPSSAAAGQQVLTGRWALAALDGSPLPRGSTLTLSFAEDGQVTGTVNCNRYSGHYRIEGARLRLHEGSMTLVGCVGMDTEAVDRYFAAMQEEATFVIAGGTLTVVSRGMTGMFRRA